MTRISRLGICAVLLPVLGCQRGEVVEGAPTTPDWYVQFRMALGKALERHEQKHLSVAKSENDLADFPGKSFEYLGYGPNRTRPTAQLIINEFRLRYVRTEIVGKIVRERQHVYAYVLNGDHENIAVAAKDQTSLDR